MRKNSRFRFKPGKVLEFQHSDCRCGYLIAHFKRAKYGNFFSLVKKTFASPLGEEALPLLLKESQQTTWLNTSNIVGVRDTFTVSQVGELSDFDAPVSTMWYGHPSFGVTIEYPNGVAEIAPSLPTDEEMEKKMEGKGIVQKIWWLPSSIAEYFFEGKPLRWSAHKKY